MLKTKTEVAAEDMAIAVRSLERNLDGLAREERCRNHVSGSEANREFHLREIKTILKTLNMEVEKLK